jgi:hypothetical protein
VTIDLNLKLENLSIEQLNKIHSCFLDIASILDEVATDFENINVLDTEADEVMDVRTKAREVIIKARG